MMKPPLPKYPHDLPAHNLAELRTCAAHRVAHDQGCTQNRGSVLRCAVGFEGHSLSARAKQTQARTTTDTTAVVKNARHSKRWLHQLAVSSSANSTPPTGARNAAATPAHAPHVTWLSAMEHNKLHQR
jgi:hypothetical protein